MVHSEVVDAFDVDELSSVALISDLSCDLIYFFSVTSDISTTVVIMHCADSSDPVHVEVIAD